MVRLTLAASLVANVALCGALVWPLPVAPGASPAIEPPLPRSAAVTVALPAPAAGEGTFLPALPRSINRRACLQLRAQHQALLDGLRAEIERRAPLEERFERAGPSNPALEGEVRALFAAGAGPTARAGRFAVRCRRTLCDIESDDEEVPPDWLPAGQVREVVVTPQGRALVELAPPGTANGLAILEAVARELRDVGHVAACLQAEGSGTLDLTLTLHAPRAEVVPTLGGPLADTPAGRCLAERIARLCASAQVDEPFTDAILFDRITSPPARAAGAPR
jgi:hypothetical protein